LRFGVCASSGRERLGRPTLTGGAELPRNRGGTRATFAAGRGSRRRSGETVGRAIATRLAAAFISDADLAVLGMRPAAMIVVMPNVR
jgi:hypothetical protein